MKLLFLFFLLLMASNGWAGPEHIKIDEPTVSFEEAEILNKAFDLLKESTEEAIEFLISQITPESSAALDFVLGNFYDQKGNWELAEAAYRKALEKMPQFTTARANLGRALIKQDKTDEAIEVFHYLLIKGDATPEILTLIGYTFLLRGQPVPAETAYRKAVLLNPDDVNAYMGLAKSLMEQGRFQETVKILEDLLEVLPHNPRLWFILANNYLSLEKPDNAIVALETSRRLGIINSEALATLGELYLNRGQAEKALIVYKEAFALKNLSVRRMLRAIEGFILLKRIEEADVLFERFYDQPNILSSDEEYIFYRLKAHQSLLKGDIEKAIKVYKKLLEKNPLDGEILIALGNAYREKGRFEEALISYERAGRISGKKHSSLILQAQVEVERENFKRAVNLLEEAEILNPQAEVARYLIQVRRLILP